jgi:O-antigen ligase
VTGFVVPLDRLFGGPAGPTVPSTVEDPLERLLLQGPRSGLDSLGRGRFVTYGRAIDVLRANPVAGSGLGALVVAEYTFGGETFDTPGKLPNVDNAWLTIGMKAGLIGILAFGAVVLTTLLEAARAPGRLRRWLLPFWFGVVALTMTQSFATTGYGPAVLGLVAVLPILRYTPTSTSRAIDQR